MRPTDTNFGKSFSADRFRSAIHSVMEMGLPEVQSLRATFRWTPESTYSSADEAGRPFDWTVAPATEVTHADVQIPVSVEYRSNDIEELRFAKLDHVDVILGVLDVDYDDVEGADTVLLGEDTYTIGYTTVTGLFDVTTYFIHCKSKDES